MWGYHGSVTYYQEACSSDNIVDMNTTAAAPAPPLFPMAVSSAGPAWHLPHFSPSTTAHVKQEPSDGEAADRHDDSGISPGRSASASGSSGGPSPEREDPGPSQHHHYFQHQQHLLSSPPPNPNGHYLERLDNTPSQTQHNAYYYNHHHQQQQNGRGQPLPQEPYYQQQQQLLQQQQQQQQQQQHEQQEQQEQSDSSAQFQLGSPAREPLVQAVPQSPQLRTPPPAGSAQTKQEPASPLEGSSSPGQPPQASSAVSQADENSSSSSHYSTEGEGALRRLQAAVETMGMVNGSADGGTTYECPVCTVRTQDKEQFQAHLGTHYEPRCPSCDHVASTVENLRAHMREAHALSPPQDDPAETKINSQGRVKTFRCKQCGFVAVTKLEFWKHSRLHIKAEKLLTCNRCPFVTEYKHHLEYHLRNHSGWKPFHCDKCDYQCVNKSMLNSHLKSHSNIYQYRCADCTYATKYCHSLKLHLRKYHHTPDVVLNPDGSPNPLPIIDVYGTRRGPKQRPRTTTPKKTSAAAAAPPSASAPSPAPPQPQAAVQPRQPLPPPPAPRAAAPPQGAAALPPFAPAAFAPLVRPGGAVFSFGNVGLVPSMPAFPYNPVPHNASDAAGYDAYYAAAHSSGFPFFVNNNNDNESPQDAEAKMQDYMARILVATQLQVPNVPLPQASTPLPDPLDLTKPESPSPAAVRSPTPTPSTSTAASALPLEDEPTPVPVPAAPSATKHRRKGKAYKLERIAMKLQYHADDDSAEDEPERKLLKAELPLDPEPEKEPQPSSDRPDSSEAEADDGEDSSEAQRDFFCEHCEITFRDVIMYSLHKGYHGLKNPFTCNACGKETADRVEFFVHIARSPHS